METRTGARCSLTIPVTVTLFFVLAGCAAGPVEESKPVVPDIRIASNAWRMVDADISNASYAAKTGARAYANAALRDWMDRVRRRTEEDFIPWYTSFGTQQWLSVKVGWYELNEQEGKATAAQQLAEYLQGQYYERVLEPIAEQTDPQQIMERTAARYVRHLDAEIQSLPGKYGLRRDALDKKLDSIPVIHLSTEPQQRASLYQITRAKDPAEVPAYAALLTRIEPDDREMGAGLSRNRFYPVARSSADELVDQLAIRGGAAVAGLAMGGVAGILISVGVSGWQAMEHEKDKPMLEEELRSNLNAALNGMSRYLTEDPYGGVMAPVNHMTKQIENGLLSAQIQTEQRGYSPANVF